MQIFLSKPLGTSKEDLNWAEYDNKKTELKKFLLGCLISHDFETADINDINYLTTIQINSFDMQNKQEEKGLITDNTSKLPPWLSNQICFTGQIDGGHKLPLRAEKDPLENLTS